jgi:pimeloyl-ACP methyl ester carboxylesterase
MFRHWGTTVFVLGLLSQGQTSRTLLQGAAPPTEPIAVRAADVSGLKLQYLTAGHGPAIVLLHGYAETSRMWKPLMPKLASSFTVIAPDLPGIGGSDVPSDGLDMTHAAIRVHDLVKHLGIAKAQVVGHDIGLMVAYAYAAQFPAETERLVLMDAFLPGVAGWEAIYNNPAIWHFRFNGPTPEALVKGRERIYFEHFWNDFAADKTRSIPEADRQAYTAAYARPGRMRSAWAYFVSFQQAATDFAAFSRTKLSMPVLSIGGERANGDALAKQVKLVASNATTVTLPNTGHWVMEERPHETSEALVHFLTPRAAGSPVPSIRRDANRSPRWELGEDGDRATALLIAAPANSTPELTQSATAVASSTMPQMRMTPAEVRANQTGSEQIGSSGLAGVTTKVLFGDPSKPGFYTIVLSVPAHTSIAAHSHRDDRIAVVVSGTWRFGYGNRFNEHSLKSLPIGSVYSEPGHANHFAQTGAEPVLVEISGYGPTDTVYVNPADTPNP